MLTLRGKLFLAITLSYLLLLLFLVLYASNHLSVILIQSFEEKQQSLFEQSIHSFEQIVQELDRITLYLSGDRHFANMLIEQPEHSFEILQLERRIKESINNYTSYTILSEGVTYVTIFYLDEVFENVKHLPSFGLPTAIERIRSDTQMYNSSAVKDQFWYQDALSHRVQVKHFIDPELPEYIMFMKLVKNAHLGPVASDHVAGVVVFAVHRNEIAHFLAKASATTHTDILLINQSEQVLAAHLPDNSSIPAVLPEKYLTLRTLTDRGEFSRIEIDGISHIGVRYDLMNQWELLASVRVSDITQQLHHLTIWLIVVVSVSVLLVFLIAAFLAGYFSKPIQKLAKIMRHLNTEAEMLPVPIHTRSRDEVYDLYTSYNAMIHRIQQLMVDVKDRADQQKIAELRALQAQINPHFLYNTLDSINWIAMSDGQNEIAAMVTALVAVLRYSIKDPDTLVNLDEEIQYLKEYWQIQQIRYQDKFVLSINMPEQLLPCLLPKMTLQPLIENALNYADSGQDRTSIAITAEDMGELILLTVTDSGKTANVEKINRYLQNEDTMTCRRSGLGIRNVNERLKITYGSEYGLSYSTNGHSLQARLLIRKIYVDENGKDRL